MLDKRTIFAAVTVAGLAVSASAHAQEGVAMKNALSSIGLIEPERPTITYRERAPLVLPPKMDKAALPPPVDRRAVREANPQWPTDPETAARDRRAAEDRKPITRGYGGRMSDNNATLPIQEMRAGRREGAGLETEPTYKPGDNVKESFWLNPMQLFAGKKDEDPNLPDVEPSRDSLTAPPTGYRKAPNGKVARTERGPMGMKSDREEADPGAYLRSRQ
ncbi:hypothetical protein DA075_23970 [Methylobacterium currus]|uniref:DUF3035 domain-containing protein n=1 Tax=Methylobacterium currus TaxID=2051553 RepID=A0A2R4WPW0_9HYPH|nr:hypothetical protein [Methylobacterium currus]AWB23573.1 hypothetical protein DA075_23970 [Methylobacterium currus]UHC16767.1 hypothetical protein LRS73_02265 [Methylobacterium currus]